MRFRLSHIAVLTFLLVLSADACLAGARREAPPKEPDPTEAMSIRQLREFQAYFYSLGGRDPLIMRFPTDAELGLDEASGPRKAPTIEEQEEMLLRWLERLEAELKIRDYDAALATAFEAINVIDNEWPPIKPEYVNLLRMNENIRNFNRLALRLKAQRDITAEFKALALTIDGVVWSPSDAKAMVSGQLLSAGEVMLATRKEGDLRVEIIEEHGVVFQYKGIRFRMPVELFSRLSPPEEE
jgi:hypothetical protein